MQRRNRNLQFVWPKDGPKGRGHRGFWGRLDNIVTGKGPDVFLQHKRSKTPITRDQWQNWDSYASRSAHDEEAQNPVSRGYERYDPYTRTYTEWATPHNWFGVGVDGYGVGPHNEGRTRFTRDEWIKMKKIQARGGRIRVSDMGSGWNSYGPKRFRPEYDDFWRTAHRQCENNQLGFPALSDPNPNMRAHQRDWWDLRDWLIAEL